MSGASEARAILATADLARNRLRTIALNATVGWSVLGTEHERAFSISFERPGRLRLIEKGNRSALSLTEDRLHFRTAGSLSSRSRESYDTPSHWLGERGFLFPTLGQVLEGKTIGLPAQAAKVTVQGQEISWRDLAENSVTTLTLDRRLGLPLSQKKVFLSRAGRELARYSERYRYLPVGKKLGRAFFDAPLPEPPIRLRSLAKLPPRVALSPAVRLALDRSANAARSLRSVSGSRFSYGDELEFEEFALQAPDKQVWRDKARPRQVGFMTDGVQAVRKGEEPEPVSTRTGSPKVDLFEIFSGAGILAESGLADARFTHPGAIVPGRVLAGEACDCLRLSLVSTGTPYAIRMDLYLGQRDRLARKSQIFVDSDPTQFRLTAYPELLANPTLPASTFDLSGAKGAR